MLQVKSFTLIHTDTMRIKSLLIKRSNVYAARFISAITMKDTLQYDKWKNITEPLLAFMIMGSDT